MNPNRTLLEDILSHSSPTTDNLPSTSYSNDTSWNLFEQATLDSELGSGSGSNFTTEDVLTDFIHPEILNITEHIYNQTEHKGINIEKLMKFVDEYPWVVYSSFAFVLIIVLGIIIGLICCVCKNKKRVIRQDNDPILTSTYESNASWMKKLCCKGELEKEEQRHRARQNSESNMESYKRQSVPRTVPLKVPGVPHYNISTFNRNELYNNNPVLREFTDVGAEHSAASIDGIRGIPNLPVRADQYRELPKLNQ